MPKLPPKKKVIPLLAAKMRQETVVVRGASLREFADSLCRCEDQLIEVRRQLGVLWGILHTSGLDSAGPLTETDDSVPF